jgi:ketosteroid isomerase-like protein
MSSTGVIKSLYEAFGQGDMPTVLELFDPQILWCEAEGSPYDSGDGWVGPDAVVTNLFTKMGDDWTEFTVHPSLFHESGSMVTVEGRYKANHRHTGKDMDCQVCHVWTVEDGKITKFQQYVDTAKMQDVMGVKA